MRASAFVLAAAAVVGAIASCGAADEGTLTVLAAASLGDAFPALAEAFEAEHDGVTVRFGFAGSSSVREQVLAGAPADVVALAAPGPMGDLVAAGAVEAPTTFATNRARLAVPAGNPAGIRTLDDLSGDDVLLGVCAPAVPCGALAEDVLVAAGVDVAPDTEEPDVRALRTKLVAGELDAGIVYATDVRAADGAIEAIDLPAGVEAATAYPIAVAADAGDPALARDFVAFVGGPDGRRILHDHGFGAP